MTNPDPQLLSLAHQSVWRGQARRKLAEDIAADLIAHGGDGPVNIGEWSESELADRIEKHLMGAML